MINQQLKDQVAFVTGGTRGIGKAIAEAFAKHGAKVVIFGTDETRGEKAAQSMRQETASEQIFFKKLDVSKTEEVNTCIADLISQFGTVDILVNNAGITKDKLLLRMDEEDWDDVMGVNVKSCYNLSKACARAMMRARKGRIINMSSVIGLTGNAGQVNYSASKAAVIGLTKSLAKELAPRHITVNCIAPGFIDTEMTQALNEEQRKEIMAKIPLGRMGTPTEVASLAVYLASSLADYMTGQVFVIDGGMIT